MIRMDGGIDLAASADAAFALLSDLERMSEWQTGVHDSVILTDGPLRVGTRFRETFRLAGREIPVECEVHVLEPGRSIAWRSVSKGRLGYEGRFTIEPAPGGSRLSYAATTWTRGLLRLLEPLWAREARSETAAELAAFKRLLESAPVPA